MEFLHKGFSQYKSDTYSDRQAHMHQLAKGQKPNALLLTCSDSRISVSEFTNTKPGEVFVIRNAGNVIEPFNPSNPSNEALTLEFGVVALGIEEIVVCGHTDCGAMQGVKDLDAVRSLPLVHAGLKRIAQQFDDAQLSKSTLDNLIALNIRQQMRNILTYPFIKNSVDSGDLKVWGWLYDFAQGEITTKIPHTEI